MEERHREKSVLERLWKQGRRSGAAARTTIRRHRVWFIVGTMVIAAYGASGQFAFIYYSAGEGQYFDADGQTLHYTIQGEGEPVILLHGFAMNQDISWQYSGIPGRLAERFQVIALDQRGHGNSSKPHADEDYGHEMVHDIARLMDHLEMPRAHIIGSSMGAIVAMRFVVDYPERVITVAPCAMGWPRPIGANMEALAALAKSLAEGAGFDPLLRHLYHGNDPSFWVRTAVNTFVGYLNDSQALAAVARALPDLAISEHELRQIQAPMLSVIGTLDPLIEDVYAMEGLVTYHEIVELDGCDHFRMASFPGYLEVLIDFLERHQDRTIPKQIPAAKLMDEAA